MSRRLALLIATYDYQDTGLARLNAPAHDAEAFAAVLRDPDIASFEVQILINEPQHRVGEAIGEFYRDRRRDDLTLLYFTGHGLKDADGRLYLAMTNTRRDNLLFTAVSGEQIDHAMETCTSRQKVLILDCCYSGAFPAGRLAKADTEVHALERFHGRGRTVLTASDSTQYSFEGNQLHGEGVQSVFTRYLVEGIRDGSADLDGDGDITVDELYTFVHERVIEEMPQQRPKKQDNVEGRTVIARNIRWTLPGYLRNAIASPIATDRLAALDGLTHLYRIGNTTVREAVREQIRQLADDDSKLVSSAAAARLQSIARRPPDPAAAAPTDMSKQAVAEGADGSVAHPPEALATPVGADQEIAVARPADRPRQAKPTRDAARADHHRSTDIPTNAPPTTPTVHQAVPQASEITKVDNKRTVDANAPTAKQKKAPAPIGEKAPERRLPQRSIGPWGPTTTLLGVLLLAAAVGIFSGLSGFALILLPGVVAFAWALRQVGREATPWPGQKPGTRTMRLIPDDTRNRVIAIALLAAAAAAAATAIAIAMGLSR